jgi:Tol biopolymer transport system component
VTPGENLVVEGIPPVPRALADSVGRYADIREASFAGWHPKRRELLIVTRFGDTNQVHLVSMPGGARRQLTFFHEGVSQGVRFEPGAGAFFTFLKDVGGNENYQLYRYDMADGETTLLSDGKSRNVANRMSSSGARVVYSSNRRKPEDMDLWVVDPHDPQSSRMLAQLEGGGFEALEWSPDDKQILARETISAGESYLWMIDAGSGAKTLLTPKESVAVAWRDARFAKDGKGLYLTTDKDSEFQRLAYPDLSTKGTTFLTSHIPWDVEDLDVSPDGKTVAFVTNEGGAGVLHLLDTASGKEMPAPKFPVGVIGGVSWHGRQGLGFTSSPPAARPTRTRWT